MYEGRMDSDSNGVEGMVDGIRNVGTGKPRGRGRTIFEDSFFFSHLRVGNGTTCFFLFLPPTVFVISTKINE
jgi:hypothetical protein